MLGPFRAAAGGWASPWPRSDGQSLRIVDGLHRARNEERQGETPMSIPGAHPATMGLGDRLPIRRLMGLAVFGAYSFSTLSGRLTRRGWGYVADLAGLLLGGIVLALLVRPWEAQGCSTPTRCRPTQPIKPGKVWGSAAKRRSHVRRVGKRPCS